MARIDVRISDESHDGWRAYSLANGVSIAALVEAAGPIYAEMADKPPEHRRRRLLEDARRIDGERRRRGSQG